MAVTYSVVSNVNLLMYTTSGTTDATGQLNFAIPAGTFNVVFAAFAQPVRDSNAPATAAFAQVRSFSATNVIVQVFESNTIPSKLTAAVEPIAATTSATTVQLVIFGI